MLGIDEIKAKIENLQQRHESVLQLKAALGGELRAKKEELANLVKEIQTAGYNPNTIAEDRKRAQEELEALMVEFETTLSDVESSLAVYNRK